MARKTLYVAKNRQIWQETRRCCSDCKESYDYSETGYDGKPFLCRCQYYKQGRFYKFLNDRACDKFQPK